jgi:hypothetical protein
MLERFYTQLVNPLTKSPFSKVEGKDIVFRDDSRFPIIHDIPVLIFDETGIFDIAGIEKNNATTQSKRLNDTNNLKNYIRRKVLPSLTRDNNFSKRYNWLASNVNGNVLVIGAGEKVQFYKDLFPNCSVLTSDVHRQYSPDIVFDAHAIPFNNDQFDLVIAGQVLEHTMKPWIVASEIQRVLKVNGLAHIETPLNFPYHAHPYDFYRFTYTGLRSIFDHCSVLKSFVTEGNASTVAVMCSEFIVSKFQSKYSRIIALFVSRYLFFWMKYFDNEKLDSVKSIRSLAIPKGIGFTFQFDGKQRSPKELLEEYYQIAARK